MLLMFFPWTQEDMKKDMMLSRSAPASCRYRQVSLCTGGLSLLGFSSFLLGAVFSNVKALRFP